MLDPATIVQSGGILIIALIIFAETGLLFGFILPGDSLLFTAGIFAAKGDLSLFPLLFSMIFASIAGNAVGYWVGQKAGPRMFKKQDGIFFRHEYIEKSELFFAKHGGKAVILSRFIPIGRTFAPVVAGIGKMDYKRFTFYNIVSAPVWILSITLLGYYVGDKIPHIDLIAIGVVIVAVGLSILGPLVHALLNPKMRAQLFAKFKRQKNS